ncbi:MAG: hypothetical protein EXX96DRAFT_543395 [Benjaminiella poitrasii]|nr:MAG: hypothetical protein EXX96DRAFT_543395 [Benjaminiella poitrasii]
MFMSHKTIKTDYTSFTCSSISPTVKIDSNISSTFVNSPIGSACTVLRPMEFNTDCTEQGQSQNEENTSLVSNIVCTGHEEEFMISLVKELYNWTFTVRVQQINENRNAIDQSSEYGCIGFFVDEICKTVLNFKFLKFMSIFLISMFERLNIDLATNENDFFNAIFPTINIDTRDIEDLASRSKCSVEEKFSIDDAQRLYGQKVDLMFFNSEYKIEFYSTE